MAPRFLLSSVPGIVRRSIGGACINNSHIFSLLKPFLKDYFKTVTFILLECDTAQYMAPHTNAKRKYQKTNVTTRWSTTTHPHSTSPPLSPPFTPFLSGYSTRVDMSGEDIWLGLALPNSHPSEGEEDAYYCKAGGSPVWLHANHRIACGVPECSRECQLVAQLFVPLQQLNRVLYVFACTEQSHQVVQEGWKVIRGQTIEADTDTEAPKEDAFKADTDWGGGDDDGFGDGGFDDSDDDSSPFGKQVAAPIEAPPTTTESSFSTELIDNMTYTSPSECEPTIPYKMVPLDVVEEPSEGQTDVGRDIEQYRIKYASAIADIAELGVSTEGAGSAPEEYEKSGSNAQRAFLKFTKRVSREPSQVIRWCFGGKVLNPSGVKHATVSACGNCGAPRVPEAQVLSTAFLFISQEALSLAGLKDETDSAAFAAATIYSCSKSCHAGESYVEEAIRVEVEPSSVAPSIV